MNSVRVNPGRVRLTPGRVTVGCWLAGPALGQWPGCAVKKKTERLAGPVQGGVGFRPKIEKRIGKLFHFKYLYKNTNQFEFKQV
jgi:hypothetical protein